MAPAKWKAERAAAEARLRVAQANPALVEAALALQGNDLPRAERLLKGRLREDADDIAALRMLAELASRLGRAEDALDLLERALKLAPGFAAARLNYAGVLHRRNRLEAARAELDRLLSETPGDPAAQALMAAVLARLGDYEGAIALYHDVLARHPQQARLWMSLGHALKTVGRREDSVAAYRRALAEQPGLGEAWWSLANLKTLRFSADDVDAMRSALGRPDASVADRVHLHYALGKALEDAGEPEPSFGHYAEGARLRRAEMPYDAEETTRHVARSRALLTGEALTARSGWGCPDPDPIFVVGLPRAGSTLVEQILASHSRVEGTMELPDVGLIAAELAGGRARADAEDEREVRGYIPRLLALDAADLRALGERFIARTRIQRKTDRPFFVDKMPNNFAHIGLIHLILPNAKIIDARRHPMASGFSAFKQHFSRGQGFTYDLGELGRYYRDYVALGEHYDAALPGRVHRVRYERMVEDPEREIRALLAACGLEFEPSCIRFHETERAVRTASSEQVRQPMNRDGVDGWRAYAPWLGPLAEALGDEVRRYEQELVVTNL